METNKTNFKTDIDWTEQFLPQIKSILGVYLISKPPIEEDMERNTDLIVLKMDAVRIACRIRRHKYVEKYGHQFTVREGRPSGTKTELPKIIEGWGNYFFYGFSDEAEFQLCSWILCDLNVFRLWFNRSLAKGCLPGNQMKNKDNSSWFRAFNVSDLPGEFLVTSFPVDRF